jgi:putative phage-type endonuclease
MKIVKFKNEKDWLDYRQGKITGTKLKEIIVMRGKQEKIGFYKLIADKIALPKNEDETGLERGHNLEKIAIEKYSEKINKKIDTSLLIWEADFNENIAISPDGIIDEAEAVECKCLSSEKHIEAYLTQKISNDYYYQVLQYFIVNSDLQKLHFIFYDDRMPDKIKLFVIIKTREELKEDIEKWKEYEINKINEINKIVEELSF